MIYSDTHGLELYNQLYENAIIGSNSCTAWDHSQPPVPPPPRRLPPGCCPKFFGPAPPSFDPDSGVYHHYWLNHEMAPKRDHEGHEVQSPSATSSIESVAATDKSKGDISETSSKSAQTAANTASNATSPQSEAAPTSVNAPRAPPTSSSGTPPPPQQATAGVANGVNAGVTPPATAATQPIQAPPPVQAIGPMQSTQLLYHALHHGNIVLSLLSTYLSQDAVLRDFVNSHRDPQQLPIAHNNVASSLCVASGDLRQCRYALSASERYGWYRQNGCFRTWEMVMDRLSVVVDIVEEAFRRDTLPTCASVGMIKTTWEDCMALRDGTADQESWQLCWDLLNGD